MKTLSFLLAYAVVALSIFAYGQTNENKQLSLILNSQYAKEMSDASSKLRELDIAVKKTLLFNESEGSAQAREDIWRLSSDIKNSISSLPMDRSYSTSIINYLGRLGSFAKEADRAGNQNEYHRVMAQASKNLESISENWEVATVGMSNGRMTVEDWTEQIESNSTNHNWAQMGDSVKKYTESDFPLTASESDSQKKKELQHIKDAEVNKEEAVEKFKQLFPIASESSMTVGRNQPGAPYPFFHIRFAGNNSVGYIDITEKGGHILSYLAERPFGNETLPFEELKKKAETFLTNAGYEDTVYEESRENNTAWHFVFVRVEPEYNAKVFSDTIHLKVAKDNGDIIGLNAMEYIRKETTNPQPIKKIDWKTFFHSDVEIIEEQLAYVENDRLEQRLSHYLTVTKRDDHSIGTFAVIVDTETAEVIKTEKLD